MSEKVEMNEKTQKTESCEAEMNEETQRAENCETETNEKAQGTESCEVETSEKAQETTRTVALVHKGELPESLKGVRAVEREISMRVGYQRSVPVLFYLAREKNDPTHWIVGLDVYDAVQGQEMVKRALLKLGMPTMDQLAGKAVYDGMAMYLESDIDIQKKRSETKCACGFQMVVSERVAAELLDRLKATTPEVVRIDLYQEVWPLGTDAEDEDGADKEDEVAEQEDEEQYEKTFEFRGLEDLRVACAKRKFGSQKYGIEYTCSLAMFKNGTWELELSVLDYDAAHSDGQEIIEMLLAECGLPGMHELSKMADCETNTPIYGEWYRSWLCAMAWFSDPDETTDAERETCFFSATFSKEKFLELLEQMQAKIPGEEIAYTYKV